jgi:hypothetical protein
VKIVKPNVGTGAIAFLLLGMLLFVAVGGRPALADNATCVACQASIQYLAVDTASFKLWPSGSKTLLDVVWTPSNSQASFNLLNSGVATTPQTTIIVLVDYHDPLTQTSIGGTSYTYSVPALNPQTTSTVTIPLDYAQCDVFVTVDLGSGVPSVFRTGNPAAC